MQTASLAPGVYYQTVDAPAPIGAGVRTDIAAFVGIAERGPLDTPQPVESWRQFVARFGGCIGGGYLAYVVRAFFENEGRRCWVVRVASRDAYGGARAAGAELFGTGAGSPAAWRVEASSPGVWGNGLAVRVTETRRAQTRGQVVPEDPTVLAVTATAGFQRATLARVTQPGGVAFYRVVSAVDAVRSRLAWVNPNPDQRLPYDEPLALDPARDVRVESVEYNIVVTHRGVPIAVYPGITTIPEHRDYGARRFPTAETAALFEGGSDTADTEASRFVPPAPIAIVELRKAYRVDPLVSRGAVHVAAGDVIASASVTLTDGTDGLTLLRADDFLGEPFAPEDPPLIRAAKRRGVRALDDVDEVAIVAIPDIQIRAERVADYAPECVPDPCVPGQAPPASFAPLPPEMPPVFSAADVARVQAALVDHCEQRGDRIALLDSPFDAATDNRLGIAGLQSWRARFESKYAAAYYPWLHVVDPLRRAGPPTRIVPPCGHVAGQIARTDLTAGVHQAPANAPLAWAEDVTALFDDTTHGVLNDAGVNALRPLTGRGLRILGARLVSSDPSWRYVSVRRLVLMIMKAIALAMQWAVFEPNDDATRNKIRLSLTVYLTTLWRRGALAGTSAEASFFVKCDTDNNPSELRDEGMLIAEVGIAPTTPWEFIVIRVWRTGNELEIADGMSPRAGGF